MPEKMMKKLQGERGASVAIALLYFLICAMAGAVIMAGASASISHVSREKRDERNYLAVRSAAELLEEEVKGCDVLWTSGTTELDHRADAADLKSFKEQMGDEIDNIVWDGDGSAALKSQLLKEIYAVYESCLLDDGSLKEDNYNDSNTSSGTWIFKLEEIEGYERGMYAVDAKYTVRPVNVVMDGDESQLAVRADIDFSIAGRTPVQQIMNMSFAGTVNYKLIDQSTAELVTDGTDPDTGEPVSHYEYTWLYTSEASFVPTEPVMSGGSKGVNP